MQTQNNTILSEKTTVRARIATDKELDNIEIEFEGKPLPAFWGESIAATLTANGILDLRKTRDGSPRGLFCGMGICHDCLVEIDGQPNQRACMTKVDRPMKVRRQEFLGKPSPAPLGTNDTPDKSTEFEPIELLVIGGGIAGMSAAATAAEAGTQVVLLDERPQLGGQFCKQPTPFHLSATKTSTDKQVRLGQDLIKRMSNAGVEVVTEAQVWGGFPQRDILVSSNGRTRFFRPDQLIVATGAYERGLPLPGWTLPGVMTTGGAQSLFRSYRVIPGNRILVAGNGPFNLQVALELAEAGATIVAIAESAPKPGLGSVGALYKMFLGSRRLLFDGARYSLAIKRRKIPLLYSHQLTSIDQTAGTLRSQLASSITQTLEPSYSFDSDIVCMGYGFLPANALLRALGCAHSYDKTRGHLVVNRSNTFETTVPGVYAIGDCASLGGAYAAAEEGVITGLHTAALAGHQPGRALLKEVESARIRLTLHRQFQSGLWRLYAAPQINTALANSETEVCRCESVTMGQIDNATQSGCASIAEVKQRTRAGMGRCQGRYCASLLAELLTELSESPIDEESFFAPRVPVIPVRVGDITMLPKS